MVPSRFVSPSSLLLALCVCSLALAACVDAPQQPDPTLQSDSPTRTEQAIINGEFDNDRQAVVALYTGNSLCSGTIIKKDVEAGIGWVLTAGHCVDSPVQGAIQANNFQSQSARVYNVIDQQAHPRYNSTSVEFDFAVVRISGVTESTPVIPVVTGADGMGVGSDVVSVGYGRTTPIGAADNDNSRRKRFFAQLNQVDSDYLVYSLRDGGICSGDSGGPVLANVNGVETVVGVHSFVTGECTWGGYSGRVQSVYGSWLAGILDGEVQASCDLCRDNAFAQGGACEGTIDDCLNDPECGGLLQCLQNCSTNACGQECANQYQGGLDGYFAIFECGCDSCSECDSDPSCQDTEAPECGLQFADEACGSCNESACCSESAACAGDSLCLDCISGRTSVGCNSNNAFNNFAQCLTDSCAGPCGIEEETGCGFSSELDDCDACLNGACCDANARCINDADCLACAQGGGSNCESNTLLIDFFSCLSSCDNDACGVGPVDPVEPGTNNGTGGGGNTTNPSTNNGTSNPNPNTNNATTDPNTNNSTGGFFGGGDTNNGNNGGGSGFVGGNNTGNSGPCSISNPASTPVSPLSAIPLLTLGVVSFLVRRRRDI